jgi:cell wall-associated NlpC family hydrolase
MNLVRFFSTSLLFLFVVLLSGCGSQSGYRTSRTLHSDSPPVDLNNAPLVKKTLFQQYKQWEGTEYKFGGTDRNGVDCSGFVYLTFKNKFGLELPRSTDEQIEIGRDVTGRLLQPGDLLFFRTGFFDRHVGIYLDNKNFIHASKDRGIMISSLDNQYWQSKFRKAKRIRQE